jgi:tetratricopeptide (TPR) repeat protein
MLAGAPGYPQLLLMLGEILSATGRHEAAVATLEPVVERWSNAGPARFCLGNALHAAGKLPEAAAQLRRATELQPHFADAHSNLGLVLDGMGDREGAVRAWERALLIEPDLAEARANLGAALLRAEKLDDAILHLRRAVGCDRAWRTITFFSASRCSGPMPTPTPHNVSALRSRSSRFSPKRIVRWGRCW